MTPREALLEAIKRAGGQTALAKSISVPQNVISYWLNQSQSGVRSDKVIAVEQATGVSRSSLRPDLYPPEERRLAVASGAPA